MWCVMIDLNLDVRIIKGIGNKSLMYLNEASIYTIKDLLFKLPKKYNIYEIKSINSIEDEELATVKAVVDSNIIVIIVCVIASIIALSKIARDNKYRKI